jgi:hypothetical protein
MKLFLNSLILSVVLAGAASSYAADGTCGGATFYQPGGSTLAEAQNGFQAELQIFLNDCSVQQKLPKIDGNYNIRSFSEEPGKETLVYDVEAFADPQRPTHSTCTLVKTVTMLPVTLGPGGVVPDPLPSKTDVSLSCTKPVCTHDDSPLCPQQ